VPSSQLLFVLTLSLLSFLYSLPLFASLWGASPLVLFPRGVGLGGPNIPEPCRLPVWVLGDPPSLKTRVSPPLSTFNFQDKSCCSTPPLPKTSPSSALDAEDEVLDALPVGIVVGSKAVLSAAYQHRGLGS